MLRDTHRCEIRRESSSNHHGATWRGRQLPDVPDELVERARQRLSGTSCESDESLDELIDEVVVDLLDAMKLTQGGAR